MFSPQLLEVRLQCELNDVGSPDGAVEQTPTLPTPGTTSSSPQESEPTPPTSTGSNSSDGPRDNVPCLKYVAYAGLSSAGLCY